jgi:UDP-N-acetylglucosamine acyltransferase
MSIHPTAVVEAGARLGAGVVLHAHAVVTRHAELADGVVVHPGAVIGGDPQYLKFDAATASAARVGAGTVVRENVTINRSIHAGQATVVGARCLLMANSHVGHDCVVHDDVVLANNVMLAGHVEVGSFTFIGGGAGVHQFARIGEGAMVAGLSRVTRDVAPFLMVAERDEVPGFNLVGLKRRGFPRAAILEIKAAYTHVFAGGDPRALAASLLPEIQSAEARRFLEFFAGGKRGFVRPAGASMKDEG